MSRLRGHTKTKTKKLSAAAYCIYCDSTSFDDGDSAFSRRTWPRYGSSTPFGQVFFNTIALPRINIGADVWGESSITTGVHERWCSSTLHIGWGLCDRLCLVLVCRGRYGLGGVVLLFILGLNLDRVGPEMGLLGGGRRGWCEEWARRG